MIRKLKKYSLVIVLLLWSLSLFAQIDFKLEAPQFVKNGHRFRINFILNKKPDSDISIPQIEDFQFLMGPSTTQSTSISIVNGKMTKKATYSYSYIFLATKEGKFEIPAASVTVDGKNYQTTPQKIEVLASDAKTQANPASTQQQNQRQNRQQQITRPTKDGNNFFVRVLLSKNKVYPNEHLVATLKLYTRYGGISNVDMNPPSFKGFLSKEVPNSGQNQFHQENIKGTIYNTVVIGKYVLFPQRSGDIVIDDFSINALAQQRVRGGDIFEDFFGNNVQQFKVSAKNPKTTVKVSPLPVGKPADYQNAVGQFNINSSLSTDSVATNEAVTLKIYVKGNGNLQMLKAPKLKFSPDLEVYEPKKSNNSGISTSGMNGSTTFEYLIIPRQAGTFELPAYSFCYFDTKSRTYKTIKTQDYTLKVSKGSGETATTGQAITRFQNNRQEVAELGNDIKFIKTNRPIFHKKGHYFWNSVAFWLVLLGIPILAILVFILTKKQAKRMADTATNKSKHANKVATKRLKTAKKSLEQNDKELFYNHTLDALWGFVSDKLHLPTSQLNKENIAQHLHEKNVQEETISEYLAILDECEMAQYAPLSSVNMQSSYDKAVGIISKLEQRL